MEWETPFQLLVAVILSAQTTDKAVNKITPGLWARYPEIEDLASANLDDVEMCLRTIGLYKNKAKNIICLLYTSGFSDALRLELADKGVYVTTVNPGPIETSFFDQADPSGAYLESVKKFVLSPKYVAKKIVRILGKNKREVNLPRLLAVAHKGYTLFPRISDKLATNVFNYK